MNLNLSSSSNDSFVPSPRLAYVERGDAALGEAVFRAIEARDMRAFDRLFERPGLALSVHNDREQNPLHVAVLTGNDEAALTLIGQYGDEAIVINGVDQFGYTPLMYASEQNNAAMMRALIEANAECNDTHHAHCTVSRRVAKRAAIIKAGIFRDAQCDAIMALELAARRSNMLAVRAFMAAGAPPAQALVWSLIVPLRVEKEPSGAADAVALSAAKTRAKSVETLRSVGADLSEALTHAIREGQIVAARALLLLGADGRQALARAMADADTNGARWLISAGVDPTDLLQSLADKKDTGSITFLVAAGARGATALRLLAENRNTEAVRVLMAGGINPVNVLINLVEARRQSAVETLIRAGADPVDALLVFTKVRDICALKLLIGAGAQTAGVLRDIAQSGIRLRAAILIAAGADTYGALLGVDEKYREDVQSVLIGASADVNMALDQLGNEPGMQQMSTLLASREHARLMEKMPDGAMMQEAKTRLKKQHYGVAALIRAACVGDWVAIQKLTVGEQGKKIASEVLTLATKHHDFYVAQLLIAAGVDYDQAFRYALKQESTVELLFLIGAGLEKSIVLMGLVVEGRAELARQLIGAGGVPYFDEIAQVVADKRTYILRSFIPHLIDGCDALLHAGEHQYIEMLEALLKAGANGPKALVIALSVGDMRTAQTLMALGVDVSVALMHAVVLDKSGVMRYLILLGADLSVALAHAMQGGEDKATSILLDAGVDRAAAIVHAAALGNKKVIEALVDDSIDETSALTCAIEKGNVQAARFLIAHGANIDLAVLDVEDPHSVMAVRTLLDAGGDATRLLSLVATLGWHEAVRELTKTGADLSKALDHAISERDAAAMTALLLLGVDGAKALRVCFEKRKLDEAALLLSAGVEAYTVARQAASRGDVALIKWLISLGKDVSDVMAAAVEDSDIEAVRTFARAGCDISEMLEKVAESGRRLGALKTLIDAGGYALDALIKAAKQGDVEIAQALIEAGANSVMALWDAMMTNDVGSAAVLIAAKADLVTMRATIPRRGFSERPGCAAMPLSISREAEQERYAKKQAFLSDAQRLSMSVQRDRVGRINSRLGGATYASFDEMMARTVEFEHWDALSTLLNSGVDEHQAFSWLLRQGQYSLARRMIAEKRIDICDALDNLCRNNETELLKTCLQTVTDGHKALWRAAEAGNVERMRALAAAGADVEIALGLAVPEGKVEVSRALMTLEPDVTAAMNVAVQKGRRLSSIVFRLLGADLPAVLLYAAEIGSRSAVEELINMGVDASPALDYMHEHDHPEAVELVLTAAQAQGLKI